MTNRNLRSLADAIQCMTARYPGIHAATAGDCPIFILTTGWRSGSTLLQRLLMPECFIWGEPYGHSCMLHNLADPLRCITDDWPEPHFSYERKVAVTLRRDEPAALDVASRLDSARQDEAESNGLGAEADDKASGSWRDGVETEGLITAERDGLSERFIANLYPSVIALLAAHRSYFDTLFARPVREVGAPQEANAVRWGFKEVRLSADYAHYLKLLYPNCKLLFLIRNPYDAYRSWAARRNAGWKWFYRWPDQPLTARLFGKLWTELAGSFIEQADVLGALVVRYEDLKDGQFEPIESYLGFKLNRAAADVRPHDGPKPIEVIPHAEMAELGDEMHALAESLGYDSGRTDASSVGTEGRTRRPSYVDSDDCELEPASCAVLVPISGSVVPACEEALAELERRGYTVRRVRGYSAIDQGRNQMATDALADGFDETMWIDSDVGFDPDDIERLRQHKVPIVCGIYPQKGRRVLACHVLPGTEKLIFGDEGGLAEILYAGTGFLLVRREAYETIHRELQLPLCNERFGGRPMVPFFQPMSHPDRTSSGVTGHWYLAEDFAFCERARQAGFKIYADTRVRLMHYGNYGYSWEDAGMELQRYRTFHFHTK